MRPRSEGGDILQHTDTEAVRGGEELSIIS